ncbi:unnamed protein product [Arctogadus glacialis]
MFPSRGCCGLELNWIAAAVRRHWSLFRQVEVEVEVEVQVEVMEAVAAGAGDLDLVRNEMQPSSSASS